MGKIRQKTNLQMPVIEGQPFYKSITFWSIVATAGISIASAILGADSVWVITAISVTSALGLYGRATAKAPLSTGVFKLK